MSHPAGCAREPEAVEAVMFDRWPLRVDRDLAEHVEVCVVCRDAVTLAAAYEAEAVSAHTEAVRRLPDGRLVWWRAQVRARQEARRVAVQPIAAAGVLAVAAAAGAASGVTGPAADFLVDWFDRAAALTTSLTSNLAAPAASSFAAWPSAVTTLAANHLAPAVAIATCLALAPLLLYVALREE